MTDIVDHIASKFTSGNSIPVDSARITAQEWSTLLAHIQRGAVPEGERAAFESWIENEAGAGAARRWLNTEAYENGRVQDYRTGWIACLEWLAAAPAPDQFRDAAKMMSEPAEPERRVGPASDADMAVYQSIADGYARDTAPAPAEVPMPEEIGWVCWNGTRIGDGPPHFCTYEPTAHQLRERVTLLPAAISYGDAREAAGYARGVAEGVARTGLTPAEHDVLAERQRQISAEGWTPEHDDGYGTEELAFAAACYCTADEDEAPPSVWPWDISWWKPTTRRRNLVKAGALILAEIERLDRAALRGEVKP